MHHRVPLAAVIAASLVVGGLLVRYVPLRFPPPAEGGEDPHAAIVRKLDKLDDVNGTLREILGAIRAR